MHTCCIFIAALVALLNAQNVSRGMFLPTAYENSIHFAASVVRVCSDETTYALRCTHGILRPSVTCGPDFKVSGSSIRDTSTSC